MSASAGFVARSLLVVLASVAAPSTAFAQAPVQFVVSNDVSSCLVVRARPQSSAPSIDCLQPGTRVDAVGTAPYWRRIRLQDGRTGWGAKKFLALVAAPAVAPATDREDAWLDINVVDVGQGDGIWIHTFDDNIPGNGRYEGYNIIVDGGPNRGLPDNQAASVRVEAGAHPRSNRCADHHPPACRSLPWRAGYPGQP